MQVAIKQVLDSHRLLFKANWPQKLDVCSLSDLSRFEMLNLVLGEPRPLPLTSLKC